MYYCLGQALHLTASVSARYTAIMFAVEGLIMPLGGVVSDRLARIRGPQFGRRWVPIVALVIAAMLAVMGTLSTAATAVACFSVAFGTAACCEGPFWATVTEIGGDHVGTAASILNTGAQIGGFFAPILTPFIGERFGWSFAVYTGALIVSAGAMTIYFVNFGPGGSLNQRADES
jgi:MFS family permease